MPRIVIIGGGLTGLTIANRLLERGLGADEIEVLEAGDRPGGLMRTTEEEGYRVEWAANGFLDNAPATVGLCERLELDLVRADDTRAAERYVVHRGRPAALPTKPPALLTSPLLSPAAKVRALMEATVPPAPEGVEESVAAFAERRFGPAVLPLVDAAVTGIHAGDPARLSLDHAFPRIRALEREFGSVLKGLKVTRKGRRTPESTPRLRALGLRGAKPGPRLTAPREGMGALVERLLERVPVRTGARVQKLRAHAQGGITLETQAGKMRAEHVVLAVPPTAVSQRLGFRFPPRNVAPVTAVALGYPRARAKKVRGFGILAPARENRFALGTLFESNLFPERAPDGHVLLRALVGGARTPDRARLPDGELIERVQRDLQGLGLVRGAPTFAKIIRTGGIPQIDLGHGELLARAHQLETHYPGLHFAGAGWRTVAVNGLIEEAERVADRIQ